MSVRRSLIASLARMPAIGRAGPSQRRQGQPADNGILSGDEVESLLDNIGNAAFRIDSRGRLISLNKAFERLTGYDANSWTGRPALAVLPAGERSEAVAAFAQLASGNRTEVQFNQRFARQCGKYSVSKVYIRRLVDPLDRFCGVIGSLRETDEVASQDLAISESEQMFRRISEAAPTGIFLADARGHVTYLNPFWSEKLGQPTDVLLGDGWLKFLKDQRPFDQQAAWTGIEQPGDTMRRILCFRAPDGDDLWFETINSAQFDDATGEITGFVGAAFDITAERLAIQQLIASEARFHTLTDLAPAGIFRTDALGACNYVNPAWLRITGLASDGWQNEGWAKALHPDDLQRVFNGWAEAVQARSVYRDEFRWVRPDGAEVWTDVTAGPEFDDAGQLIGFVGVVVDVTERHFAAVELAARDEQLSLLADNATDAVFRLTLDGRFIYASPSIRHVFGLQPETVIGRHLLFGVIEDDQAMLMDGLRKMAAGEIDRFGIVYRTHRAEGGEVRWVESTVGLVRDAEGLPQEIISSVRDVTKRKVLEAQLTAAREHAEQATQAKATFLAHMSHEIRTPMNGVLGFAELLGQSRLDPEQREQVRLITESGRAMLGLLNDILDMSKIEAGEMRATSSPFNVHHKLTRCIRMLDPVARSKGVALVMDVDPELPRQIQGDPLRVRQILLNLIGNALKFTENGQVRVTARKHDDRILIAIEDTGVGIPQDRLETIFEKFSQADLFTSQRFGGTGLGLTISAELARLMNGSISVESTPGEGSTFTLDLPLLAADESAEHTITEEVSVPLSYTGSNHRILVAEDHDINQTLIMSMAKQVGLDAALASDGAQAVAMVEAAVKGGDPFRLVLMDVHMPTLNGLEATRALRKAGFTAEDLPIVALTANAYAEDIEACLGAGMQAHLAKPVRLQDLTSLAARFFEGPTAPPQPTENSIDPSASGRRPRDKAKVASLYVDRKNATLQALARAMQKSQVDQATIEDLVDLLHKLAGTAGFFGEEALGSIAAELEHELCKAPHDHYGALLAKGHAALSAAA